MEVKDTIASSMRTMQVHYCNLHVCHSPSLNKLGHLAFQVLLQVGLRFLGFLLYCRAGFLCLMLRLLSFCACSRVKTSPTKRATVISLTDCFLYRFCDLLSLLDAFGQCLSYFEVCLPT